MATIGGFGRRTAASNGGAFPARELLTWPHQGHRLWASMPDAFWVYVFKVQRCRQPGIHDWRLCPYAHRGERARRRDPRRYPYMAVACPDYRASHEYHLLRGTGEAPSCVRGLTCRYAHGVFELWLHPERFRTRMCDAGTWCPRKICFFAHHPAQRRREDDAVPFVGLPLPPPPVPRPPPSSPRVVAPVSSLPRPGMMMQTRSGQMLPLHGSNHGASSSSSAAAADTPAPTPPVENAGPSSVGSSRRRTDEDSDDFPHLEFIMDVLNSATMD